MAADLAHFASDLWDAAHRVLPGRQRMPNYTAALVARDLRKRTGAGRRALNTMDVLERVSGEFGRFCTMVGDQALLVLAQAIGDRVIDGHDGGRLGGDRLCWST